MYKAIIYILIVCTTNCYSQEKQIETTLIKDKFKTQAIFHKTVLTQGIGEAKLAEKIEVWRKSLTLYDIKLAFLPLCLLIFLVGTGTNVKGIIFLSR